MSYKPSSCSCSARRRASALWRLEGDLVEDDATVVEDETTLSVKESGRVVEDNDAFLSK